MCTPGEKPAFLESSPEKENKEVMAHIARVMAQSTDA
jgi:hypothetical protein